MSKTRHIVAFVDTNIFLHYRQIQEIDWLLLLNAELVEISIAPIVIRELEEQKVQNRKKKLRERANRSIMKLASIFRKDSEKSIRESVTLHMIPRDPEIDFKANSLNTDINDDWLIATVIDYKELSPEASVILVTNDLGLQVKAEQHRIQILELPEELKLPTVLDEEEAKIRDLQAEVSKLQSALPRLKLTIRENDPRNPAKVTRSIQISTEDITNKMNELERKHSPIGHKDGESTEGRKSNFPDGLVASFSTLNEGKVKKYNEALPEFYEEYRSYIELRNEYENMLRRRITLCVALQNLGTAPAEDIDIFMHFPDGLELFDATEFPDGPKAPTPPERPNSAFELLKQASNFGIPGSLFDPPRLNLGLYDAVSGPSNVSSPLIKRTNSYDVEINVRKIKHNQLEPLDELYVLFDDYETAQSFQIQYRIHADNVPDEVVGEIDVLLDKSQ